MWWVIGYIAGAVGMVLFVVWSVVDYPQPRTTRSVVYVTLAILFWPIATIVILIGFIYKVADAILFEERRATDAADTCDQQNPPNAKWCRRCGKRIEDGEHVEEE